MTITRMTTEQKRDLIWSIMSELKNQAAFLNKSFDEGVFFNLAFKTDKELLKIKKLCNL